MKLNNNKIELNGNSVITNRKKVKNVQEFISFFEYFQNEWKPILSGYSNLWFRGVKNSAYPLVPGIYREKEKGWKYTTSEAQDVFGEFQRRSKPFVKNTYISANSGKWVWYHLMQHYGLPTRLLDWTEGALIALFFALRDHPQNCPCVWFLDPFWLNEATMQEGWLYYSEFDNPTAEDKKISKYIGNEGKLPSLPAATLPPHIDPRIASQKSVFTIHGSSKNGFQDLSNKYKSDARIAQIIIGKGRCDSMLDNLCTLGISETTLFPDLEGLAREIRRENDMV